MAVEGAVFDCVVVGAFDEDGPEAARGDLGGCNVPDSCVAGVQRDRVRLDVAEDDDFVAAAAVTDEECRAFYCRLRVFFHAGGHQSGGSSW